MTESDESLPSDIKEIAEQAIGNVKPSDFNRTRAFKLRPRPVIMPLTALGYNRWQHPDVTPEPNTVPKFDPMYGFTQEREQKVMKLTQEEMESAKIPHEFRDYCAHKYLDFLVCKRDNMPWVANCHHAKHEYFDCQHAEYVDRVKDFERERRLMERAKRIAQRESA